eukprot:7255975-Prymnesium_polylepis.1
MAPTLPNMAHLGVESGGGATGARDFMLKLQSLLSPRHDALVRVHWPAPWAVGRGAFSECATPSDASSLITSVVGAIRAAQPKVAIGPRDTERLGCPRDTERLPT